MATSPQPNHLAQETSPYLQQHAFNPVEWFPWGSEALERARAENKPILLSIGYSACHWCHVMAHESFEDPATARVMNGLFVNIKVDREERPDLDKIYQNAHFLLTQRSGGWPLTMFLTPDDQVAFFGGTYFPKEPRHGLPAFSDLLRRVADFYQENRGAIREQNARLVAALRMIDAPGTATPADLGTTPLEAARTQLAASFDARWGGFGQAPKFPHPTNIERLLRHWAADTADEKALDMAVSTLEQMARGGIYDQLGGGFCRYSVDERWEIPHFEKMLYDNGPLLGLYAQAWQATGRALFRHVAIETGQWVIDEMQAPAGGYYSTLDADSEGEEGKFYVWQRQEVEDRLTAEEFAVFARRYGLDGPPNFEGKWHLRVQVESDELARQLNLGPERIGELLSSSHQKLFDVREGRVRPGRDEKVLAAWNGLMIKGMAIAGRLLDRPELLDSAERAATFLRTQLVAPDGRLLATYKDGKAHLGAYLDDQAFLLDGILELLQGRWRPELLEWATGLADDLLARFEDPEQGGFFFTAVDHERLIHRPKPLADEATPGGNGIAAYALGRLGHLLGEPRYLDAAERTIKAAWPALERAPHIHGALLLALEEYLQPPQTLILRGTPEELSQWLERVNRAYAPRRLALPIPNDAQGLPGLLAERRPDGPAVAYVCHGTTCLPPVKSLTDLKAHLRRSEAVHPGP
jgi:uncharacterized protein YyaL (SSP411 family)